MTTIQEAISGFLTHCTYEKKLSKKTLKAYKIDCQQFDAFVSKSIKQVDIQKIDHVILKDYVRHLSTFKPKTIKRKLATIKAMYNFLEFEDELMANPFRKIRIRIKEPISLPRVMTLTEVGQILNIANQNVVHPTQDSQPYKKKEKLRNRALLELLFASGMRVSEICNLKIDDLDLESGQFRITGKGNKQRIIQVCHDVVLKSLREYYKTHRREIQKNGHFFLNRKKVKLSEQSVRFMVSKYSKDAGVKKHVTPHVFRHSFATLLLEQDVDIKYIQQFLGHSSITTTQIYTHVNYQKQKEILQLKHPRIAIELN